MSFKKGGFESDNDEDENVGHLGYNMNPDNVIELRVRARSNPNFCISQLDDADDIQLNRQLSGQDILNEIRRRSSRHLTPNLIPAPTLVEDPALEISITIADELRGRRFTSRDTVEHLLSVSEMADLYGTRINQEVPSKSFGLDSQQAAELRFRFGPNKLSPPIKIPLWLLFLLQFTNIFMILLLIASFLAFIAFSIQPDDLTNLYLGILLFIVVIATCYETFAQEAKSENLMEQFRRLSPEKAYVYRNGILTSLPTECLVVGDLIQLSNGDKVPADARVINTNGLKCDQSMVTGESDAINMR